MRPVARLSIFCALKSLSRRRVSWFCETLQAVSDARSWGAVSRNQVLGGNGVFAEVIQDRDLESGLFHGMPLLLCEAEESDAWGFCRSI